MTYGGITLYWLANECHSCCALDGNIGDGHYYVWNTLISKSEREKHLLYNYYLYDYVYMKILPLWSC